MTSPTSATTCRSIVELKPQTPFYDVADLLVVMTMTGNHGSLFQKDPSGGR